MAVTWNPDQYGRFAGDRGRPFFDLLGRVGAEGPRLVVDLGCGPGNLTAALPLRWPTAKVVGIDSSAEMIAAAKPADRLAFEIGDIKAWTPGPDVDVVITNAALQWVPTHRDLLRDWGTALPSGAWMAWQVPGNFNSPSHTLMRELAESDRWSEQLAGVLRHDNTVDTAAEYAALLLELGLTADTWETTYTHVLDGEDPVLQWVRGTGLRPVLDLLDPAETAEFEAEYAARLRVAYPRTQAGTLFPFRRIFAVGHKP
ncbi:trans-aconitate 2-methyltransferase [Nakamurella sp. UYEF19]|uniref:trans-aconitate 2-methyltransferase n=1 Tax=Nakamurella sp. UYEF19 TaxID=1756392 RepID=UPI003398F813